MSYEHDKKIEAITISYSEYLQEYKKLKVLGNYKINIDKALDIIIAENKLNLKNKNPIEVIDQFIKITSKDCEIDKIMCESIKIGDVKGGYNIEVKICVIASYTFIECGKGEIQHVQQRHRHRPRYRQYPGVSAGQGHHHARAQRGGRGYQK